MTTRGASRIASGIALVAVLSVVGMVTWSVLHPSDPGPALPPTDGPALGDMTGYVGRVDPSARTVDVAENLFGLRPVMMVMTNDTSIVVGGKEGGIGDLSKDMPVRAFYEVRNDVKYVTSIQVIIDAASRSSVSESRPPVETRPTSSPPAVESKPAAPPAVVSAPPATRPPVTAPPVAAATPRPSLPAPPLPARTPDPSPVGSRTADRPEATEATPPRAAAPVSEAASVTSAARPADTDGGDGSAVIDWLFERRR